jgi:hypothetical protein
MSPAESELGITTAERLLYPVIDIASAVSHPIETWTNLVEVIRERKAR